MWVATTLILAIALLLSLLYLVRLVGIAKRNRRDASRAEEALEAIVRELHTGDPSLSTIRDLAYAASAVDLDDVPEGF